jgi:hypothetical protein
MADTPRPGSWTVLAADPDLVPALRPLASRPAAQHALVFRPHDPLAATGVLLPADLRADAASVLEPRGFQLVAEDLRLDPATPSRGPGGGPLTLPRGPRDLYVPRRAWLELVQAHPGEARVLDAALDLALAELDPWERDLLRRAAAERDLLAMGDLLQMSAVAPPAATARVVRAIAASHAADDASRLGDLVLVLQHDQRDPGVTPLARLALGAALWQHAAPGLRPDAALERALAEAVLAVAPPAPPPGPLDPPSAFGAQAVVDAFLRDLPPDTTRATAAAFEADAGEAGLAAAVSLGQDPALDEGGRLGLVLGDAQRGLPAAVRRRRARRLLAGGDAVRAHALLPELAGLDHAVAAIGVAGADRERTLSRARARLDELSGEDRTLLARELQAARASLEALRGAGIDAQVLDLLDLALASVEGRDDLEDRARRVLEAWTIAPSPAPPHELSPALEVLARRHASPFDPARASARELEALVHLHALRRRSGGEPPRALVLRAVARDDLGVRLTPFAAELDPQALALLLGMSLPLERAVELLRSLHSHAERLLLVAPRDATRWEGLLAGERVAVTLLDQDELPTTQAADLARRAAGGDGLELPTGTAPCALLGPGRYALVASRLDGRPVAPDPALLPELSALLQALHERGFVLGADPIRAARRRPDGRLGLAGFDPLASADPARRAAGQRADQERLAALASLAPAHVDDLRAGVASFLDDLLGEGQALSPREAQAALPPWLATGVDDVRDALLDLDEERWAAGRAGVDVRDDGRFQLGARA